MDRESQTCDSLSISFNCCCFIFYSFMRVKISEFYYNWLAQMLFLSSRIENYPVSNDTG